MDVEADVATGQPKKRTFKKFSYRGVDLDALLDMPTDQLVNLFVARARRRWSSEQTDFLLVYSSTFLFIYKWIYLMIGFDEVWRENQWLSSRSCAKPYAFSINLFIYSQIFRSICLYMYVYMSCVYVCLNVKTCIFKLSCCTVSWMWYFVLPEVPIWTSKCVSLLGVIVLSIQLWWMLCHGFLFSSMDSLTKSIGSWNFWPYLVNGV